MVFRPFLQLSMADDGPYFHVDCAFLKAPREIGFTFTHKLVTIDDRLIADCAVELLFFFYTFKIHPLLLHNLKFVSRKHFVSFELEDADTFHSFSNELNVTMDGELFNAVNHVLDPIRQQRQYRHAKHLVDNFYINPSVAHKLAIKTNFI